MGLTTTILGGWGLGDGFCKINTISAQQAARAGAELGILIPKIWLFGMLASTVFLVSESLAAKN